MEEKHIEDLEAFEEESDEAILASELDEWRELALEEAILRDVDPMEFASVSSKPWSDFSQADYSLEQWHKACLIHVHSGAEYTKSDCKLPILEPSGALNKNGVHAAAARINQVDAPPEEKKAAAKRLISAYRQLKEKPPASLLKMAGSSMNMSSLRDADEPNQAHIYTATNCGPNLSFYSPNLTLSTDTANPGEVYEFHLEHSTRAAGQHNELKHGAWSKYNPFHDQKGKGKKNYRRAFRAQGSKRYGGSEGGGDQGDSSSSSSSNVPVYSEPAANTSKFVISLSSGTMFFYDPSKTSAAQVISAGKESGAISDGENLAIGSYSTESKTVSLTSQGSAGAPGKLSGTVRRALKKYFAKYTLSLGDKAVELSSDYEPVVFSLAREEIGPDYLALEQDLTGKEWLEAALYREQAGLVRRDLAKEAKLALDSSFELARTVTEEGEVIQLAKAKTDSSVYPGLERVPGIQNWVDKVNGLPDLIERSAKHIHYEAGRTISAAIATAVNWAKKMCATGRAFGGKVKVSGAAQEAACQAVSEWEAKKAAAHGSGKHGSSGHGGGGHESKD